MGVKHLQVRHPTGKRWYYRKSWTILYNCTSMASTDEVGMERSMVAVCFNWWLHFEVFGFIEIWLKSKSNAYSKIAHLKGPQYFHMAGFKFPFFQHLIVRFFAY